jgi:hypothetical protein
MIKTPSSALVALLLLSACQDSDFRGNINAGISPNVDKDKVTLDCRQSSSGTCYFMIGEDFETIHEVKAGSSKQIQTPTSALPVCAIHDIKIRNRCSKETKIGPQANPKETPSKSAAQEK